jgi:hypothetical protein
MLEHSWNADSLHRFFVQIKLLKSGGLMYYKWAFVIVVEPRNYFQGPYFFPNWGSPQGCEDFNEVELMYPEAALKASFPKTWGLRVEITNRVSSVFDKRLCTKQQNHEWSRAIRTLAHWLKRPPMKKEATLKMQGSQKTSDEERGDPKNTRGSKDLRWKKRQP